MRQFKNCIEAVFVLYYCSHKYATMEDFFTAAAEEAQTTVTINSRNLISNLGLKHYKYQPRSLSCVFIQNTLFHFIHSFKTNTGEGKQNTKRSLKKQMDLIGHDCRKQRY